MKGVKVGYKVSLPKHISLNLGLPEGIIYTVKDILEDDVEYNIVLCSEELGKDWVQFFTDDELIIITK